MSKPSLRELLRMSLVSTGTRLFFKAIIKELEALRELVEPEECPQGCDATIRKLREELAEMKAGRDSWERWHGSIRAQLSDERAELKSLRKKRAEAKAEIERLCHQVLQEDDRFRHIRARLTERREYWEKRCLKAEHDLAHLEITSADAEIGRLVRRMRPGSKLECDPNRLSALRWWGLNSHPYICQRTASLAEALRAIQREEGDDSR